jgi:hypothetical protein
VVDDKIVPEASGDSSHRQTILTPRFGNLYGTKHSGVRVANFISY